MPFALWLAVCGLAITGQVPAKELFQGKSLDEWAQELPVAEGKRRANAAHAIAQLAGNSSGTPADEEGFAELIKLASDSDPAVRYWGANGLAMFGQRLGKSDGGRRAAINAIEPLLTDKVAAPRIAAALALGQLGQSTRSLDILIPAMSEKDEAVRVQAAQALANLGPAATPAEAALRAATKDSSAEVRQIAARALASLAANK